MTWPAPGSVKALELNRARGWIGSGSHARCCRIKRDGLKCQAVAVKGRRFCRFHGGLSGTARNDPAGRARRVVRRAARSGVLPPHVLALPVVRDTLGPKRRRSLGSAVAAEMLVSAFLSGDKESWARVLAELREKTDGR